MRAVIAHGPRTPAELVVEEVERPVAGDGRVLVHVRASSANPVDLFATSPVAHIQRGLKPGPVGTDFAGVVEEVGSDVADFRPGDEVFGAARGAFAEYVRAEPAKGVVHKPAGVSFEEAGTLAVAGSTALQALRDHGRVKAGARVLVNGASGGVGTFAVQIARALGADVTAVCSTGHLDVVRSLGAARVVDYTTEDFTAGGDRYDVMIDVAGSRTWAECKGVLVSGGTYVGVGVAAVQHGRGGAWRAIGRLLNLRVASIGGDVRFAFFIARLNTPDLAFLGELVAAGQLRPVIEARYPLGQIGTAMKHLDGGHAGGKIAIQVDQ